MKRLVVLLLAVLLLCGCSAEPVPTTEPTTAPTEMPTSEAPTSPAEIPTTVPATDSTQQPDQAGESIPWWALVLVGLGAANIGVFVAIILIRKK